jgi:hypothetical protein
MALHTARCPPSRSRCVRPLARRWQRECSGLATPSRCAVASQSAILDGEHTDADIALRDTRGGKLRPRREARPLDNDQTSESDGLMIHWDESKRTAHRLPVIELDDPTVVDEINNYAVVPAMPPRDTEPHARILDTESTGGQISGEVSNASPLPSGRAASERFGVVGLACIAVLVGLLIGLAIGAIVEPMAR